MRYPEELVHQYGAKAGIQKYIKQQLPDIPQAKSVTKHPSESLESALQRADEAGVQYPRLYRSSAIEELDGREGEFPTKYVPGYEEGIKADTPHYHDKESFRKFELHLLSEVEQPTVPITKPVDHKYPNKICVDIAEFIPSRYIGTLIKHPNQEYLLASIHGNDTGLPDSLATFGGRAHATFKIADGTVEYLRFFSSMLEKPEQRIDVERDLLTVASWYPQIISLPEIDDSWSWQVEFALCGPALFQVRPLMPLKKSDHKLNRKVSRFEVEVQPIVIGTTGPEGELLRMQREDSQLRTLLIGSLHTHYEHNEVEKAYLCPNLGAAVFTDARGLLTHEDIKVMRKCPITIYFPTTMSEDFIDLQPGAAVRLHADGAQYRAAAEPKAE
jgi:hypothetical protein